VAAFLLEAIAPDPQAVSGALQHALDTNLSAREIAGELCLSVNTVKTHQRHLYQKLGARSRTQAVEQARALGLLASFSRRREQYVRGSTC
jgi:Bacterial regulatory proteins, luxR family